MLENSKAYSGFAAPDLDKLRPFYEETLGLKVEKVDPPGFLQLEFGSHNVLIYDKPDFEPASYTVLNFPVEDIDKAVDELASNGVEFEKYDGFDHDEKGVDRSGPGGGIAWFKDPAGNILSVHGEPG